MGGSCVVLQGEGSYLSRPVGDSVLDHLFLWGNGGWGWGGYNSPSSHLSWGVKFSLVSLSGLRFSLVSSSSGDDSQSSRLPRGGSPSYRPPGGVVLPHIILLKRLFSLLLLSSGSGGFLTSRPPAVFPLPSSLHNKKCSNHMKKHPHISFIYNLQFEIFSSPIR